MVAINDGDGWVSVTRPETTDIALGGNETDFPGKFFRELASRDKCIFDLILTSISIISTNTFDISANTGNISTNTSNIATNTSNIATLTTRTDLIPGRNKIINGSFDIWQRGTSFNLSQYTADRWVNVLLGSSASTVTRQNFTLGQTDVTGNPSYYYRATVTSGGTAGSGVLVQQRIEDVRTFQGQTVTVSFWAKANATKSVSVELEQNFGTGGSPSTVVTGIGVTKLTLTSSWAKYTATVSIPSISGKTLGSNNNDFLAFNIWFEAGSDYNSRTNTLGLQSGTFDIAQVQIEEGSTATKFEELPLSTQLQLCQRYYGNNGGGGYILYGNSLGTLALASLTLPVSMRTAPTVVVILDSSSNCSITANSHGTSCVYVTASPVNSSVAAYIDVRVSVDAEL
jgi:hypothetical protein